MTSRVRVVLSIAILCAGVAVGCAPEKSERELLIEASTLAASQRYEDAEEIFERVYAANPQSAEVLIRYSGFAIDTGDMEKAAEFFDVLAELELNANERGRVANERRRYFERIYSDARGDAPTAPADRELYEEAILGLIEIDRSGPYLDEYVSYLIMQARAALGGAPERALQPGDASGPAANATVEQARGSLVYLERLLDGDPRVGIRGRPDPAVAAEGTALREFLRRKVFDGEWTARWTADQRQPIIDAGRYDANIDRFTIHHVAPHREGFDATTSVEVLTVQAQTWFAREIATDLSYELAGVERAGADPLPYAVADFTQAQATNIATDPAGNFTFDLSLPLDTVQLGGWLLRERQRQAAGAPAEGSGEAPTEGSGEPVAPE